MPWLSLVGQGFWAHCLWELVLLRDLPFLCLLVSGGNTQLVMVSSPYEMKIIGKTIDDAAGETFDKVAKILSLPYPGGPHIDKLAKEGNPKAIHFAQSHIPGYDYSFSGVKTSILYTLRDALKTNPHIDKLAKEGNPKAIHFAQSHIPGYDYSFSGVKTSILYTLRDALKTNPH